MSPRLIAILYRVARLAAEVPGSPALLEAADAVPDDATLLRDLERAVGDLDGIDPGWRERNPRYQKREARDGIRRKALARITGPAKSG